MDEIFLTISIAMAIFYGIFLRSHKGSNLASFAKTSSMALLSFYVFIVDGPTYLMIALLFSAIGDFALSRIGERAFMIGLISFAIAHIFYILLFAPYFQGLQIPVLIGFASLAASTVFWLLPYTGKLRIPVIGYIIILTCMGIFACASGKSTLVILGAISFVLSDLLLSIRTFRVKEESQIARRLSLAIWVFYYGGQFVLMKGWLSSTLAST